MRLKRLGLVAAMALGLAGCGNDASQPKVLASAFKTAKAGLTKADDAPGPTAAQIKAAITPEVRAANANKPMMIGTSLRVSVSAPLVLAGQNNGVRTYFSTDGVSFSLRNGVMVASRGLGMDLMSADVSQVMPRIQAGSGRAVRVHNYLNGQNQLVPHRYDCGYARSGAVVTETCSGEGVSFENRYTLRNGRVVVSDQWVNPTLGSYRLEDIG